MHDRAEDLQGLASPAATARWWAAGVAALILLGAGTATADPETIQPTVTRRGWQLDLTGYVQVDSIAWSEESVDEVDATGMPLNRERFLIRRGRLRAEARLDGITGAIEFDGNTINGATARLLAAQVGYAYPANGAPLVAIIAGLFRTPFGVEVPMSERLKPFLEPPAFARALFPGNYDAGVMASGGYGLARWSIALVNGAPAFDAQWRGRDPSSSYDLVGRIGAVVEGPLRLRVEAGASALAGTGLHPGTPGTKDELQWVDENQDGIVQTTELQVISGASPTASETFDRQAIGIDLQLHWCLCALGTGMAFFEGALATNLDRGLVYADPIASDRDLRHLGFAVGFVQNVTPHAQIGARYDRYDADRDAAEREGLDIVGIDKVFSTLSVMATARYHEARFVVQYDHERNPFGRGDSGMPSTREADRVSLRAQVGF
ncbi:MAG: phosphate-selective porin [Myxococcales bacterium]|nr:phosphate-selective porin [Myxococcales bacterium]